MPHAYIILTNINRLKYHDNGQKSVGVDAKAYYYYPCVYLLVYQSTRYMVL